MRSTWLACLLVTLTACPSIKTDPGEGSNLPTLDGPTVEFDPANSVIPFPNNLVLDPATHKVALPMQACETPVQTALRMGTLNQLDGFGTFEAGLQVTFANVAGANAEPDMATFANHIAFYKVATGATAENPVGATQVPFVAQKATTLRFSAADCTTPATIDAVNIIPMVPLDEQSTYVVALLDGVATTDAVPYLPSSTWALIRQSVDPVTVQDGTVIAEQTPLDPSDPAQLAQLIALDGVWQLHAPALQFLDQTGVVTDRTQLLVAATFTTQTTTDPLDPGVAGSLAAATSSVPLLFPQSVTGPATAPQFIQAVLGQLGVADPAAFCAQIGCANVGQVMGAGITSTNYQVLGANPLTGAADVPGQWSDPVKPSTQGASILQTLIFVPKGTAPAGGWPTVVFGHGLGSQKESLFVFAPQLATAGFASVAIDFVDSGSRAVRITTDPTIGCAATCAIAGTSCTSDADCTTANDQCTPTYAEAIQCFQPFLSTDLGATRDTIRQTVLDLQRVAKSISSCGATGCNGTDGSSLQVDPTHIVYAGISLGGIIGSTTNSVDPIFQSAVLNVSGMGLLDILENTQTEEISCSLVDALIDAGILVGAKFDPVAGTGLCTSMAWEQQPGYQQFRSIARWVLDPADGANYASKLALKRFLLMEVVGDKVVPNIATDDEGALTGLTPGVADACAPAPCAPSLAITTDVQSTKWVRYPTLPPDAGTGFPGNTFVHASLLQPANTNADGLLGTVRVQTDAITFLVANH